jgi:hypothetical protein
MVNLSYKQIIFIVTLPLIAIISLMLFIEFLEKYQRTIEIFNFSENEHFISMNNRIGYKGFPPLTPNKEVLLHLNITNKHAYPLSIKPSAVLSVEDEQIKNKSVNEFQIMGNENDIKKYPFHVGPNGQNEFKLTMGVWNSTNRQFLGSYTAGTNFKVSAETEELTSYSVLVAAIALGISAPVGFVTIFYSHKTQKSNILQLTFQTNIKVFEMLSGDENKTRWKKIYAEYWRLKDQNKPVIFEGEIKKDAYAIREKLNQIGVLYVSGALNKKILLDTYGSVFIRLWISMYDDIQEDRKTNPEASRFFQIMYNDAEEDWGRKHKIDPKMYPEKPMPYRPTFDSNDNIITRV